MVLALTNGRRSGRAQASPGDLFLENDSMEMSASELHSGFWVR